MYRKVLIFHLGTYRYFPYGYGDTTCMHLEQVLYLPYGTAPYGISYVYSNLILITHPYSLYLPHLYIAAHRQLSPLEPVSLMHRTHVPPSGPPKATPSGIGHISDGFPTRKSENKMSNNEKQLAITWPATLQDIITIDDDVPPPPPPKKAKKSKKSADKPKRDKKKSKKPAPESPKPSKKRKRTAEVDEEQPRKLKKKEKQVLRADKKKKVEKLQKKLQNEKNPFLTPSKENWVKFDQQLLNFMIASFKTFDQTGWKTAPEQAAEFHNLGIQLKYGEYRQLMDQWVQKMKSSTNQRK